MAYRVQTTERALRTLKEVGYILKRWVRTGQRLGITAKAKQPASGGRQRTADQPASALAGRAGPRHDRPTRHQVTRRVIECLTRQFLGLISAGGFLLAMVKPG